MLIAEILIALQGYEKCFALCQYTTGLIIKEIQKVKLILSRQNTERVSFLFLSDLTRLVTEATNPEDRSY